MGKGTYERSFLTRYCSFNLLWRIIWFCHWMGFLYFRCFSFGPNHGILWFISILPIKTSSGCLEHLWVSPLITLHYFIFYFTFYIDNAVATNTLWWFNCFSDLIMVILLSWSLDCQLLFQMNSRDSWLICMTSLKNNTLIGTLSDLELACSGRRSLM